MNEMRIYVASLSDYNNARLEGKHFDLSDYSNASELMEAIQEMLDELTEKYKNIDGEVREEFAVHDYEGIPSTLASEYMSEQDFQQLYDIAEVADDRGIPVEVLIERAGDTGSDDYQALADSLMFVVDGYDESDIVAEYESQLGDLGSDFWSNHIYIDDVTERVIYGEDVDRFREDILYENPDIEEAEAERQAEEMADEEAERREDLTTYLEDMGYGDEIPSFVSKDYEGAWKRSLSYDFDVINHDGRMYIFTNNYSLGGTILSGMIGAYIGYKVGRAKPQKKGFETEKRIGRKIKGALTKKKMARGGNVNTGRSWHQDRRMHNKSESYEKPMSSRKKQFAKGGGVGRRVMPFLKFEYANEARKKLNKGQLPTFDGGLGFNYLPKEKKLYYLGSITGDWKEVGEFSTKKESIDWLSSQLKMESFAKGGGVDDYFTMKDGSKMSKVEWYKKMEDKLGFEKLAERILKDSQFGQKINTPSNELTHNRLNKKAVIGKKSVTISSYTPNYNRYLDSKTFDNLKELDDYLNENQILAQGGGVSYNKNWEVVGINKYGKMFKERITLGRMSDKEDVKNALRRRTDLNIREVTSIKEVFAKGGEVEVNTEVILTENRSGGAKWRGVVKPFMLKSIEENQYSGGFKRYEIDIYEEVDREPDKQELKEVNEFFEKIGGRYAKGGVVSGIDDLIRG